MSQLSQAIEECLSQARADERRILAKKVALEFLEEGIVARAEAWANEANDEDLTSAVKAVWKVVGRTYSRDEYHDIAAALVKAGLRRCAALERDPYLNAVFMCSDFQGQPPAEETIAVIREFEAATNEQEAHDVVMRNRDVCHRLDVIYRMADVSSQRGWNSVTRNLLDQWVTRMPCVRDSSEPEAACACPDYAMLG